MKEYSYNEFGARLKFARKVRGISQIELAKKVGISQQGVQRLEVGKVKNTRRLVQIAYFLDVSLEWLMFGEGVPPVKSHINDPYFWLELLRLPIFAWEDSAKVLEFSSNVKEKRYFSLLMQDKSMLNLAEQKTNFPVNDRLFFCNQFQLKPDNFVIAQLSHSPCLTFRQYVTNGDHYILKATNPRYKTVAVTKEVTILGKLVHRYTDLSIAKW